MAIYSIVGPNICQVSVHTFWIYVTRGGGEEYQPGGAYIQLQLNIVVGT